MSAKVAYSTESIDKLGIDIKNKFGNFNAKFVVFFASAKFDPNKVSEQIQSAFPNSAVIGNSTAGEIISGKMLKNSVVVMAMDSETISDVKVGVVENISGNHNLLQVFDSFEKHYNTKMSEMDYKKYVGIILVDGLSRSEEKIMDTIGDLTNVMFIGGAAGDDLQFKATFVYANGKAYTNSAVLALLKPTKGFDFIKTQSFCPLGKKLIATKVDEANREVLEFNNKPASQMYAEALQKTVEEAKNYFMHNPVGLMINNEPYVRSPQQIKGNSMVFYCNIKEGMELSVLESTDIVKDTKKAVEDKIKELGSVAGIIDFHCILRTLELEQKKQTEDYGKIFENIPTIGFSTYGEEFIGHINQTSTMLIFK